tara:strand:+ start:101 stop:355 length:255 start_codon:yes stop_codon:yes gene_type:complete
MIKNNSLERGYPSLASAKRVARFLNNAYSNENLFKGVDIGGHRNYRVGLYGPRGLVRYIPPCPVRMLAYNDQVKSETLKLAQIL